MGWFSHVSDSIFYALCAVFKTNPASNDSLKRFVPAYIQDATNAQAPRNVDICYYAVTEAQDSGFDYIQMKNVLVSGVPKVRIKKTVPVSVLFTFYGDNADDDAELFWEQIQWDSGYESARSVLRRKNIVPIGKPDRPVSLYETEGTFQRRRCDVRMNFAYLMITDNSAGYVNESPEIGYNAQ